MLCNSIEWTVPLRNPVTLGVLPCSKLPTEILLALCRSTGLVMLQMDLQIDFLTSRRTVRFLLSPSTAALTQSSQRILGKYKKPVANARGLHG